MVSNSGLVAARRRRPAAQAAVWLFGDKVPGRADVRPFASLGDELNVDFAVFHWSLLFVLAGSLSPAPSPAAQALAKGEQKPEPPGRRSSRQAA